MDEENPEAFAPLSAEDLSSSGIARERDGWAPLIPVPADAPPFRRPLRCSELYLYKDGKTNLLQTVCRFNGTGSCKSFSAHTYCVGPKGQRAWYKKALPAPRPLYGLDRLAARPGAPVIVVEGEKKCEPAEAYFPDHVAVTSFGGAGSAKNSDWTQLAGRKVVIWPDADEPGSAYAAAVVELALRAGAISTSVVQIPTAFLEGWDLADSLPDGVGENDLADMLAQAKPVVLEVAGWPAPDMLILNETRRPPPLLPLDAFGPWSSWVEGNAEATSSPPDYGACALLAAAASLIGNARWVQAWQGWIEPSVLWVGAVGSPSSGKSPAMAPIAEMMRRIESDLALPYDDTLRTWQTEQQAAKLHCENWEIELREAIKANTEAPVKPAAAVEPEKPGRPRIIITDTTKEAVCDLLAGEPRGVLAYRDELAGWLGGMDRYGGSGERSFWTEAFGGRPYSVDRKKYDKPLRIPFLSASVLGGIQPDRLVTLLMSGDDDGLPARFLLTWPAPVAPRRPTKTADNGAALDALKRLRSLNMATDAAGYPVPLVLPLAPDAANFFQQWRERHYAETQSATGMLAGHFGKYAGILLRLALVLEHLWWSLSAEPAPKEVSIRAVAAAARLLDEYFGPMAQRAYGDAAIPEAERLGATLARWIFKERPTVVNASDLRRNVRLPGLREDKKVTAALEVMQEADWLRPKPSRQGHSKGRQKSDYEVNPLLWAGDRG